MIKKRALEGDGNTIPNQNNDLFRPLFAAATAGPISLLYGNLLAPNSSSKLSNIDIVRLGVYGEPDSCPEKKSIEALLWNLLIDGACQGPDIILQRLPGMVDAMEEILQKSASPAPQLRLLSPSADIKPFLGLPPLEEQVMFIQREVKNTFFKGVHMTDVPTLHHTLWKNVEATQSNVKEGERRSIGTPVCAFICVSAF